LTADPPSVETSADFNVDRLSSVIGARTRELRIARAMSVSELARRAGLSKAVVSKVENSQGAANLQTLARLASALEVPATSLFQGLDEEHDALFTRAGTGPELIRPGTKSGHRYQLLGSMRGPAKRMEPMVVTLSNPEEVFPIYQHPGTEILYMLEGSLDYSYSGAVYRLEPGDALQFDGEIAHGPAALLEVPVRFLSVIAYGKEPNDLPSRPH
jgi:transcriptional regulator with XRE-family HTH domain/quercetin dioxygenase-like cupin family protein